MQSEIVWLAVPVNITHDPRDARTAEAAITSAKRHLREYGFSVQAGRYSAVLDPSKYRTIICEVKSPLRRTRQSKAIPKKHGKESNPLLGLQ